MLEASDLPLLVNVNGSRPGPSGTLGDATTDGIDLGRALDDLEENVIRQVLARTGGNKSAAARLLGISKSQLFYKVRKFHIGERRG